MKRIFVIVLFLTFTATLAYSVEVPQKFKKKAWTPLMWETMKGDIDEVKSLLGSGVDVLAKNSVGITVIDIAKNKKLNNPRGLLQLANKKSGKRSLDGRFVDNGDGTITDTKTNLMWVREDSYVDLGKCIDWNNSNSYVSGLSTGGHKDWRLPTVKELKTIHEESKFNVMTYDHDSGHPIHLDSIFADGAARWYWSSETVGACCARTVGFSLGTVHENFRNGCGHRGVRAVRR